jgi:hypothetical protein
VFCNILGILFVGKKYEGLLRIFAIPNSVLTVREGRICQVETRVVGVKSVWVRGFEGVVTIKAHIVEY